jgi:hypothetical protein
MFLSNFIGKSFNYFYIFYLFSVCFGLIFACFGSIETPKHAVTILKRNNRNKHLVSDCVETSFGSSFGCFESNLVSQDTLVKITENLNMDAFSQNKSPNKLWRVSKHKQQQSQ